MASWTSKVENERYTADVYIKRRGDVVSRNGYDPEKYIREVEDEVLSVTVAAPDHDSLKKKVIAVLEGGL